ncbi:hypothetical protein EN837_28750, partial [bacterium M00.F.Ca.ET.194.01.1.1]
GRITAFDRVGAFALQRLARIVALGDEGQPLGPAERQHALARHARLGIGIRGRCADVGEGGHRGCRLAVSYPEIAEMQARAIFEAAVEAGKKAGALVVP